MLFANAPPAYAHATNLLDYFTFFEGPSPRMLLLQEPLIRSSYCADATSASAFCSAATGADAVRIITLSNTLDIYPDPLSEADFWRCRPLAPQRP